MIRSPIRSPLSSAIRSVFERRASGGAASSALLDAPLVYGSLMAGETLTAYDGIWSGSPSITRRWLLNGLPISGQTGSTYVLSGIGSSDEISIEVTADFGGSAEVAVSAARSGTTTLAEELAFFDSTLTSSGVMSALDGVWLMAGSDSATGKINRKSPGTFDLVAVGTAPTYNKLTGFASAGFGSYLNTGIDPTVGSPNFSTNSNSMGLWSADNSESSLSAMGYGLSLLNPHNTGAGIRSRNSSGTADSVTGLLDARGLHVTSRSVSTHHEYHFNAEHYRTTARASSALTAGALRVCSWSDGAANHYPTTHKIAMAFIGGALTQAQIKTIRDAAGRFFLKTGVIKPYIKTLESGIPTKESFTVVADIEHAYDPGLKTRLVVAAAADTSFLNPVFIGDWAAISPTPYHCMVKHEATGLSAGTSYIYRVETDSYNGDLSDGTVRIQTGATKTAPASALAFRMIVGSCLARTTTAGSRAFTLAATFNPDLLISIGDDNYDDNTDGDRAYFLDRVANFPTETKRSSRYGARGRIKWSEKQALYKTTPSFYLYDDHDFVSNDLETGLTVSGSIKFEDVAPQIASVYREQAPHPRLIDSPNTNASAFEYGGCAFVVMDCQAKRDQANETMLGASQLTAVLNEITDAGESGKTILFLVSTTTWANAHAGWRSSSIPGYTAEHDILNNHIADVVSANPQLRVVILTGDMHEMAADDGAYTDYSTTGIPRIAQFVCSPWNSTSLHTLPFTWNGASSYHATSNEMLAVLDVNSANTQVTVNFYNIVTGAAVLVATYNTADLSPSWA